MADIAKVSSLINKLLTLSRDGGATEAEAALAAEKAQALMMEHNLSMANVEAAGGQSGDDGKRVQDGISHRQVYKWQRSLMTSIADLNFCFCKEKYEVGRGFHRIFDGYQLIGRAANVATTRVMFDYLLQTIERLARADIQDPTQYFTRYAHSFKEGCSDRIVDRLRKRRDEDVERQEQVRREQEVRNQHPASASSNALVVVLGDYVQDEMDLNEDFRKGLPPGTTRQKRLDAEREYEWYKAQRQAKEDQRKADLRRTRPDIDPDGELFEWMVSGLSEESYYAKAQPRPVKAETEIQRNKRLAKEERERRRWQEQQWRLGAKRDWTGYDKGRQAGDRVGLDQQIDKDDTRKIT